MQYLTYQEYLAIGGICDNTAFDRNITRATSVIDAETHKRLELFDTIPDEVKALCRDLVDLYARNDTSYKTVTSRSQSAGAVSESESYATETQDDVISIVDKLVYDYLLPVCDENGNSILYRGCKT